MHEAVGENGPGGIEDFGARPNAHHRPVSTRRYDDLAAQHGHRASEGILGVVQGATLGDIKQDGLDSRVGFRDLSRSAQEI